MTITINNDNSVFVAAGNAKMFTGPDTLFVDQEGFLITTALNTFGANLLDGPWSVTVNGSVRAGVGGSAMNFGGLGAYRSKLIVGTEGSIFSGSTALSANHLLDITNNGNIISDAGHGVFLGASGDFKLVNTGYIWGGSNGLTISGDGKHTIQITKGQISGAAWDIEATGANGQEIVTNATDLFAGVSLGGGDDSYTSTAKASAQTVDMGSGNNKVTNAGTVAIGIIGEGGADTIVNTGLVGDYVATGGGNDAVNNSGKILTYIDTGAGDDQITNAGAVDHITSGSDKDTIVNSGSVAASIETGTGDDTLTNSGTVGTYIQMGDGADKLNNTGKAQIIDMGKGDDVLVSGAYVEAVNADEGTDTYALGGGDDSYYGDSNGTNGNDTIDAGAGLDNYMVASNLDDLVVNLDAKAHGLVDIAWFYATTYAANQATDGAVGKIGVDTIKAFENVQTGGGKDIVFGTAGANGLYTAGGGDDLWGFAGNDSLDAGAGADDLIGGLGRDMMWGGADAAVDTFWYLSIADSGKTAATRDYIIGFEGAGVAGGDIIELSKIDANALVAGDQAFTLLAGPNSAFTGVAGQLRYFWSGYDTVVWGDVNGDKKADFSIAFEGTLTFAAGDFKL